ncbi:MAG: hypothetical protein IJ581_01140 [Paludibacteraceae bacterium]|nr:hypothetical protein [Paludibacteraceae bacterium]
MKATFLSPIAAMHGTWHGSNYYAYTINGKTYFRRRPRPVSEKRKAHNREFGKIYGTSRKKGNGNG